MPTIPSVSCLDSEAGLALPGRSAARVSPAGHFDQGAADTPLADARVEILRISWQCRGINLSVSFIYNANFSAAGAGLANMIPALGIVNRVTLPDPGSVIGMT